MTNLDSVLKSRDITLPTKVPVIKAMVFPVNWAIKKAERWTTDAFELWCWRRLKSPLDCKEIKLVNPKGDQPWIFIGRMDAEARWLSGKKSSCQCRWLGFNPWIGKIPWSRKWQFTPVFLHGKFHEQRSLVGYSPWGCKEPDAEAEAPILWLSDAKSQLNGKDPDAGKDWGHDEKGTTEDKIVGWHHQLNGHEFEQTLGDSEGQGNLACCSP